jgi:hypothetical protein
LSWEECQPLAARFCEQTGIPSEPSALTAFYRRKLAGIAAGVDVGYPSNSPGPGTAGSARRGARMIFPGAGVMTGIARQRT